MKFQRTPQFLDDYNHGLNQAERDNWDNAFSDIVRGLQGDVEQRRRFRMKKMQGWPGKHGIWEAHVKYNEVFTYHFNSTEDGEKRCFFRRIGTHEVYKKP